ncbi:MAG TPA: DNA polymerase II large subunit, partial [Candidatus Woesearchaeota archaeon]|nr:DNA polymerase II large subunit [Candidatus Woesearchaeota archaeon]
MEIEEYFKQIETEVQKAYDLANKAKQNSYDPDTKVSIPTANNIFERVEGLIGSLKPELIGSGLARRIQELDKKYGSGDWRVGLKIAEEVARGGFCSFADDREAIELGVRVGLAYLTMGVVAAPLEGFIEFKIKDRNDGGKYGSVCFAGPIRAAGGTAAAVTLLLADYLRRKFDLQAFDITENEIARNISECESYHERVARLQYYPSNEELNFLLKNLPVEINGDPTSEREVMIHKDLPRIGTSRIRGGMCLVLCEGLAQKSPKLLKKVEKWGDEFELSEWAFLKEYIEIKTRVHSKTAKTDSGESSEKIKPNTVFIEEIVAGRPIFAYPMTKGGFRCRYGRSPFTGLAAAGIHPATMHISGDFIATGAQLRLERPSKACAATPCSTIKGPVVKLMDESVVELDTEDSAIKHKNSIKEILFLGDILIPYGEFARSHHILVPSPYVAEWWRQDLKKAAPDIKFNNPLNEQDIVAFSEKYKIPLHPSITYFYRNINPQELLELMEALIHSEIQDNSILIPHNKSVKKILEDLYLPHKLIDRGIFIESGPGTGLLYALGYLPGKNWKIEEACSLAEEKKEVLEIINKISSVEIKDVAGCYIGA